MSNDFLDTNQLQQYIDNYYGYGCWSTGKFWFVGIEEGGGNTKHDLEQRLKSWESQGKPDLMDCKVHHLFTKSFQSYPLQKMHSQTWTRLILTKLGFDSKNSSFETRLDLLNKDWGQFDSSNLLIELFPLPSPGVNDWFYPSWVDLKSELYFLENRELYKAKVITERISNIKSKIEKYKPEVVLFYGKSMQSYWDEIIGTDQLETMNIFDNQRYTIRYKMVDKTFFVQCPQPSYIRNYAFWTELGEKIKALVYK